MSTGTDSLFPYAPWYAWVVGLVWVAAVSTLVWIGADRG